MRLSRRAVLALTAVALGPALPRLSTASAAGVVPPRLRTVLLGHRGAVTAVDEGDVLVGVTWASGTPQVEVRWLTSTGWTAFATPEDDSDVPDPAEQATARRGTAPAWRPRGATQLEVRVRGAAQDLRLVVVGDGPAAGAGLGPRTIGLRSAAAAERHPLLGTVHRRADWGADESLRTGKPSYAKTVRAVVVHHTAGSNDYTRADVPRRIRADYAYHVKARGWSDLGYNLVVDRFGRIWEGRAGGLGKATVGTHAAGFNTGTLGVSLLGDLSKAAPTPETVRAVTLVAAYAAATWQFDPRGKVTVTSGGSPRYRKGTKVTLDRVQGHKDTGKTACPGALYDRLPDIRTAAARMLGPGPRILDVTVSGAPVHAPTPLVVSAELSMGAPWVVEVHDRDGVTVARAEGEDNRPHLEWNGLRSDRASLVPAEPGDYTWHVRADDGFHPRADRSGEFMVGLPIVPA